MGGEKITSIVELRAGPKHNGNIYQCFAHNPTFFDDQSMQGEPNATIRLEVLCKFPGKTFWKIETANAIFWMYLGGTA